MKQETFFKASVLNSKISNGIKIANQLKGILLEVPNMNDNIKIQIPKSWKGNINEIEVSKESFKFFIENEINKHNSDVIKFKSEFELI